MVVIDVPKGNRKSDPGAPRKVFGSNYRHFTTLKSGTIKGTTDIGVRGKCLRDEPKDIRGNYVTKLVHWVMATDKDRMTEWIEFSESDAWAKDLFKRLISEGYRRPETT